EAVRFLRGLPRAGAGRRAAASPRWGGPVGRGPRPATRAAPGAVCLPGPGRLGAPPRGLRPATAPRRYGPPGTGAAGAAPARGGVVPGMGLALSLSADASRGFSGEGGVLDALATDEAAGDAELVAVLLAWEPRVDVADLAAASGLTPERVRAALVRLG